MSIEVSLNTSNGVDQAFIQWIARQRPSTSTFAIAFCAMTLAGCERTTERVTRIVSSDNTTVTASTTSGASIPLPARALLNPQPEPNCEFKAADLQADNLRKLDYERQCYRHAELIARNRLHLLQSSLNNTLKALQRGERSGS